MMRRFGQTFRLCLFASRRLAAAALVCGAIPAVAAAAELDPLKPTPPRDDRPNILLILIDDMNDYSGAFDGYVGAAGSGHPQAKTPLIERFLKSAETTNFLSAYPPVPACKGVRSGMFSGLSPATTGVVSNASVDMSSDVRFQDFEYMHKYFRNRGYTTFAAGKLEHGTAERDDALFRKLRGQGVPLFDARDASFTAWDEYVSYERYDAEFERLASAAGYDVKVDPSKGELREFFWDRIDLDERHWTDYKITSNAIRYLRDYAWNAEPKPFFAAVGIINPHKPWVCPGKYFDMIAPSSAEIATHFYIDGDLDDVGVIAKRWAYDPTDPEDYTSFIIRAGMAERQKMVHSYLACGAFADAQVGRLLDALRTYGLDRNTIVVLASDHGYMTGEKNGWGKLQLWEDALRVPFGIRVPRDYLGGAKPRPQYIFPVNIGAIF